MMTADKRVKIYEEHLKECSPEQLELLVRFRQDGAASKGSCHSHVCVKCYADEFCFELMKSKAFNFGSGVY